MLVDDDEAARIDEAVDPAQRRDAAEGGQHHRIGERQLARRLDRAVVGDFLDRHLARLDLFHPRAGDPLDVVLAHFALEQALGVADAIETEMADIRLGGDKGHRHAVANAATPEFGLEDEGELVGGAEARGALHRAGDDRAGILAELLEADAGLQRMVDVADRRGVGVGTEALDLVKGEELDAFDRSIDVHISRIRAAIEDDPKRPRRIITVRGAGYVFAKKQDGES